MNNDLKKAYKSADYWLVSDKERIVFKVDATSLALDAILESAGVGRAIFITASNPGSQVCEDSENRRNNDRLLSDLKLAGFKFMPGFGGAENNDWPVEESWLVLGMPIDTADILARQYAQNAYLVIETNHKVQLRWVPRSQ